MRSLAKRWARKLLPDWLLERLRPGSSRTLKASTGYELLPDEVNAGELPLREAWNDPAIPPAQRAVVDAELLQMYAGQAPAVFRRLAEAVRASGCEHGRLLEVGCASGYYSEVLRHLLGHNLLYCGLDYSAALLAQARHYYPSTPFVLGDAASLPLGAGECDVLISGCVLLHVADYPRAIAESARASRGWVVFHRTPVVSGPTLRYTKFAYGVKCLEIAFGEAELLSLFQANGLRLAGTYEIGQNDWPGTHLRGYNRTYLCQKMS